MGLYGTVKFADTFYGSAGFNSAPGGLANLNAYQNNIDTVVLYWTLSPCPATIGSFAWTVQTDTVDTFDSSNLRTYISTDQKIVLSGPLVAGNTVSVQVDTLVVSVGYATSSNATLAALAAAIATRPSVASAVVVGGGLSPDDSRTIKISSTTLDVPPVLADVLIVGGASQANGSISLFNDYIAGKIHKGMAVPTYPRLQGASGPMYWQAKGIRAGSEVPYIASVFNELQAVNGVDRDSMLGLIADIIYKKTSDSNIYKIHDSFGSALDDEWVDASLINNDYYLSSVRDVSIQDTFGTMVNIVRPLLMKAIDFREILRTFFVEARQSPLYRSVRNMVRACLAMEPTITNIRDMLDLYVADSTVGQEVDPFYVPDDTDYLTITFGGPLITDNIYSVDVGPTPISVGFSTDSNITMLNIATNLAYTAGIVSAGAIYVGGGTDDERVILVTREPYDTTELIGADTYIYYGTSEVMVVNDDVYGEVVDPFFVPIEETVHHLAPEFADSVVTGGASQVSALIDDIGAVEASTVWNNQHLANGVIIDVTNPVGSVVSKAFLQGIVRKLNEAQAPVFIRGIN